MFAEHLNAVHVITGHGHRFGKGGRGNHQLLEHEAPKYGFTTELIPMQDVEQNMISSTLIRNFLSEGAVDQAAKYLGYSYPLTGRVVHGEKKGNQLGFPTANIEPSHPEKLIPADGVYAVSVSVKGIRYQGMLNIGLRPTLNGTHKTIEVHLFDFNSVVYDETITITFEHRIRAEQRFASVELLRQQLFHDKEAALSLLNT
jgi:riboflavin kinase/FMN adenylyltransferase